MDETIKKNTRITFELIDEHQVMIKLDGEKQGVIWSSRNNTLPYPHDERESTRTSVQICGFDNMSEVWTCGIYPGRKDCVVQFIARKDSYYQKKMKEYEIYVRNFFEISREPASEDYHPYHVDPRIQLAKDRDVGKLMSFPDWLTTFGAL